MKKLRERPEMRTVTLLVVGECYEDESRYRHMVEELGLSSCVRLVLEYVPQKEVATYFGASDVVVLPYLTATQSGIVQIAYNFNKPVIATSVGGLAEVMIDGKTGLVVPPNDPVALAGAIEKYYTGMLEQDFAAHVLEQKKKYSWDGMAKAIETLAARVEDDSL
jgi:glycosyltransferase involved in cell wall biosynthesis